MLLVLALAAGSAHALPTVHGKQIAVQAVDVQHYLDGGFPQHHKALGGLLKLTVSNPKLTLPPGNQLKLSLDLAMAAAGSGSSPLGRVTLSSGLRYDTAQQGFFLDSPHVDAFHAADGSNSLDANSRALLDAWLADFARKRPIYRIDPDIARLMGALQVKSADIENGHLVVNFNQDIEGLIPANLLRPH